MKTHDQPPLTRDRLSSPCLKRLRHNDIIRELQCQYNVRKGAIIMTTLVLCVKQEWDYGIYYRLLIEVRLLPFRSGHSLMD